MDFNADIPSLDVFDISPCFTEASKLKFQVKFPGLCLTFLAHLRKDSGCRSRFRGGSRGTINPVSGQIYLVFSGCWWVGVGAGGRVVNLRQLCKFCLK